MCAHVVAKQDRGLLCKVMMAYYYLAREFSILPVRHGLRGCSVCVECDATVINAVHVAQNGKANHISTVIDKQFDFEWEYESGYIAVLESKKG